jgi:hypothetical protein
MIWAYIFGAFIAAIVVCCIVYVIVHPGEYGSD